MQKKYTGPPRSISELKAQLVFDIAFLEWMMNKRSIWTDQQNSDTVEGAD